jgi:hypothetical protein
LSYCQDVGQNHDINITNMPFENVPQFKYLGTTVTNQNLIQKKIKKRLITGNACYHSVKNILFYHLLHKNIQIKLYKTVTLWFYRVLKLVSDIKDGTHT